MNQPERNIISKMRLFDKADFVGMVIDSPNGEYTLLELDGYSVGKGKIALFEEDKLLFKKKLARPNFGQVNNEGTIICTDWLGTTELSGKVMIFDKKGDEIFSIETTANLGNGYISSDSKWAMFDTYNSNSNDGNKIFIINIIEKVATKIQKPIHIISSATIKNEEYGILLTDRNGCEMQIDFMGNMLNDNYMIQLLDKNKINDLLLYYQRKPKDIRFNDKYYLKGLEIAIEGKVKTYTFGGLDKIYREIGEYYEKKSNIEKTILYWEKAIQINPKVGIKRKLIKYKSL